LFIPLVANATPELEIKSAQPTLPTQAVIFSEKSANNGEITLTQELISKPELTRQMLNRAIDSRQFHLLPELVRIYQQTPNPDLILIDYANGIILASQGDYKTAIDLYRGIIAKHPNF
ncbi:hypothetical protein ACOQO7_13400, partial [Glaesserella parasuis]